MSAFEVWVCVLVFLLFLNKMELSSENLVVTVVDGLQQGSIELEGLS